MANFFYTDANGQKQGPITDQQLKALAAKGIVTPNTPLETDSGHKGVAGQIPGLQFNTTSPSPTDDKKGFGSFVKNVVSSFESESESTPLLSRFTYIFLAVLVGVLGIHDFYAKRIGMAGVHVACLLPWIFAFLFLAITSLLAGLGIRIEVDWFKLSPSPQGAGRTFGWTYFFFFVLPFVSYVMAMIEIVYVTKDGIGRDFERF